MYLSSAELFSFDGRSNWFSDVRGLTPASTLTLFNLIVILSNTTKSSKWTNPKTLQYVHSLGIISSLLLCEVLNVSFLICKSHYWCFYSWSIQFSRNQSKNLVEFLVDVHSLSNGLSNDRIEKSSTENQMCHFTERLLHQPGHERQFYILFNGIVEVAILSQLVESTGDEIFQIGSSKSACPEFLHLILFETNGFFGLFHSTFFLDA